MPNEINSLKNLRESLNQILIDVSALEINTIIVKEITPNHFIPWQAYRDIYPISPAYLQQQGIKESLWHYYLDLRFKLELEYALLLTNPLSKLYKPNTILPVLTQSNLDWNNYETRLPSILNLNNAETITEIKVLLQQPSFLRGLRKLAEIKSSLDNYNQVLQQQQIEAEKQGFFAQTVIQLDGNIINRYSPELLNHPQQNLILNLHQISVREGEKQWEGLLNLLIKLVKNLFQH